MLSKFVLLLALAAGSIALELPPTDQTVFNYPADGAGINLPFPSSIAALTGLSAWPAAYQLAPFTPNMAKIYNPAATAIIPDIVYSQDAFG